MGLNTRYFTTSRTTNEVNEVGVGGGEGAGSELGSSPKNEMLGSPPHTIATGMSFAKVKDEVAHCSRLFIRLLLHIDA